LRIGNIARLNPADDKPSNLNQSIPITVAVRLTHSGHKLFSGLMFQ
jgi:hypothetical protein